LFAISPSVWGLKKYEVKSDFGFKPLDAKLVPVANGPDRATIKRSDKCDYRMGTGDCSVDEGLEHVFLPAGWLGSRFST
jgi:hypothetical protein